MPNLPASLSLTLSLAVHPVHPCLQQVCPECVPNKRFVVALQVPGLGIDSIASVYMDFGYKQQPDELSFAEKKLRARWFAPPNYETNLPRLFVSELQVGCPQYARCASPTIAMQSWVQGLPGHWGAFYNPFWQACCKDDSNPRCNCMPLLCLHLAVQRSLFGYICIWNIEELV